MVIFKKVIYLTLIFCFCLAGNLASASVAVTKIPAKYNRFKQVLNKNLDISVSGFNKNYVNYIGSLDAAVPLTVSSFANVSAVGTQFLKDYAKHFGVLNYKNELKLNFTNQDWLGQNYFSYRQYYKNIPVYGGEIIVQVDDNNQVRAGSGKFVPAISLNVKPKIKEDKVILLAKAEGAKDKMTGITIKSNELVILNPRVFDNNVKDKNYLAWNMILVSDNGWSERVFVDAKSGQTLQKWPLVKSQTISAPDFYNLLNLNTARAINGSGTITRQVWDCKPDGCMQNSTVGNPVFTDPPNARSEGEAAMADADIDDIYSDLGSAFNYFKDTFDYWGANGMGGLGTSASNRWPLLQTTVYGHFIATSTWGSCPNSWGGAMALEFCNNTVNITTVGHEYMHGVSDFNKSGDGGFDYINESGAVEEAYADIFGQAITRYATGASTWEIGAVNAAGIFNSWRNIIDPTNANKNISGLDCPCPERQYGPEFYCGGNWDNGGVHRDSTVISHMAYILSTGGNINGCDVSAIGQDKVEQIFYHAFRHNLPKTPDFMDLYNSLLNSCITIYNPWSDECKNLVLAMQGAELDQDLACHAVATAPVCNYDAPDLRGLARFGLKKLILLEAPKVDAPVLTAPEIEIPIVPNVPAPNTPAVNAPVATPPPAPTVEETEVRTPSFDITVDQNGKNVTVNGVLNYYGKGVKCSGPRYFDPIIVRWGQVDSHPVLNKDNTFIASHEYVVKNKTYDLSVSVTNSCSGSYTFHKTLTFPL